MAVDDCHAFHKENMKKTTNKYHYTVFSRWTHGRAVKLAQKYGAKCHINEVVMSVEDFKQKLDSDFKFEEGQTNIVSKLVFY